MKSTNTRRDNVTQADVNKCIEDMLKEGEKPTATGVLETIGGSFNTIPGMFEEWKKSQEKVTVTSLPVPDFVRKSADELCQKIWDKVESNAEEKMQRVYQDSNARIEDMREERNEFLTAASDFEQQLEDEKEAHTKELDAVKNTYEKNLSDKEKELIRSAVDAEKMKSKDKIIGEHEDTIKRLQNESEHYKLAFDKQVELFEQSLKNGTIKKRA